MKRLCCLFLPLICVSIAGLTKHQSGHWSIVETKGSAAKRHEHAFVKVRDKFYVLGGRRIQPVDIYDPGRKTWSQGSKPPMELHHFQALEIDGKVLIAGAFTGNYPGEIPVAALYFYDPSEDKWMKGPEIPEERRRGSSGAFLREGKLYLVCGLTDGHRSGWVPWFDEYDFKTGKWRKLPDAPRGRDHFQAALVDGKLVLAGGRRSGEGGSVFAPVVSEVDVYDFGTGKWTTLEDPIPTPRAGTMSFGQDGQVFVIGGESGRRKAHTEVEILNLNNGQWTKGVPLDVGRHATQPVLHQGKLYLAAGSVTRGGTETNSLLEFELSTVHTKKEQ